MDTVTAVLEGQVMSLCTQRPVPVTVHLVMETASYHTVAAANGTFGFYHIPAGKYALTASHSAYRALQTSHMELGTGDIVEVKLGMSCSLSMP
jgi:hypothetical protein